MMDLDINTKLDILQKRTLCELNDVLEENYQFGDLKWVEQMILNPDNKWKQHHVDKAILILKKSKDKAKLVFSGKL